MKKNDNMLGDLFNFIKGEEPEIKMREGKVPDVGKDSDEEIVKKLREDIAVSGKITPELIASLKEQMPDVFGSADQDQLVMGIEVELEHGTVSTVTDITGDDLVITAKIAVAHLNEIPDYYTRLAEMEQKAKEEMAGEKEPIVDEMPDAEGIVSPTTEMPEARTFIKKASIKIAERNWKYTIDFGFMAPYRFGDKEATDADAEMLGKKAAEALKKFSEQHPELADELESDIEAFENEDFDIEAFDYQLNDLYSLGDNLEGGIWINTDSSTPKGMKEQVTGIPPKVLGPSGRVVGQVGGEFDDKVVSKDIVILARGISDEGVAKDIAAKNRGQVIQDTGDETKFMVVSGVAESKVQEASIGSKVKDSKTGIEGIVVSKDNKIYWKPLSGDQKGELIGPMSSSELKDMQESKVNEKFRCVGKLLDEFEAWRAETHEDETISSLLRFIEDKHADIDWDLEKALYDEFKSHLDKQGKKFESFGVKEVEILAEKLYLANAFENRKTLTTPEKMFLEETKKIKISEKDRRRVKNAYGKLKGKGKKKRKGVGAGYGKAY